MKHAAKRPFQCSFCPESFPVQSSLIVHERTHTGERPFKCDKCGKAYVRNSQLKNHIKLVHTDGPIDKPFKCDRCPMQFTNKDNLDKHLRTHTGERPYMCEICSKSFSQKHTLVHHRQDWQKAFVCILLGTKNYSADSLNGICLIV